MVIKQRRSSSRNGRRGHKKRRGSSSSASSSMPSSVAPRGWWSRSRWRSAPAGPVVDRRAGHTETVVLFAVPAAAQQANSMKRRRKYASSSRVADEIGLLLAGQLAPVGIGGGSRSGSGSNDRTAIPAGSAGEYGLSLRLLSAPRKTPLMCRKWLKWMRLRSCWQGGGREQWTLRAATATQPSSSSSSSSASSSKAGDKESGGGEGTTGSGGSGTGSADGGTGSGRALEQRGRRRC